MTRKHYQAFADLINNAREDIQCEMPVLNYFDGGKHYTLGWIASQLAFLLEDDNPRFDRVKFLAACGITED
jgi:hypothetical protein